MIIVRLLICLVLFYLPFILFVAASRNKDNALCLIFPIYGTIPAVLSAVFIFLPIESYLNARALGHLKTLALPLAGSLLIVILMLLRGNLPKFISQLRKEGMHLLAPLLLWSMLGAIWGALWRFSDWLLAEMKLI